MTALPAPTPDGLALICDGCGQSLNGISSSIRNWDVVWALLTKYGWSGSPMAIGPHQCPACDSGRTGSTADGPGPAGPGTAPAPRPREPWRADIRTVDDVAVVELHGDLDVLVGDDLRQTLARAANGHRSLVLDLADVRLIDSTGLGLLVRAHQQTKGAGGMVCLSTPSRFIVTVLHTMRLHPVFPTFGNSSEALAWLAKQHAQTP